MRSPDAQRMWRLAARYSSIGVEIFLMVAVGSIGGWWLDGKLDTKPVLFWLGLAAGVGAAARTIYRVAKRTKLSDL